MYKLTRRKNLIPFLVLLGIGLVATVAIPPLFPENVFEIPAFALFPAEIALVMMLSVFFFENATPPELLRLSFTMLAFTMLSGGICNLLGRTSQTLPDQTLLLNLIQLACMNVTGLVATIALYQTKAEAGGAVGPTPIREVPAQQAAKGELLEGADQTTSGRSDVITAEKVDANNGESVKDILGKLDVDRINSLESSLKNQQGTTAGSVSFESLFADESSAATDGPAPKEIEAAAGAGSLDDLLSKPTDEAERHSMTHFDSSIPAPPVEAPKPVEPPKPTFIPEPTVADASSLFDDLDIVSEPTPAPVAKPEPVAKAPESSTTSSGTLFDDVSLSGDLEDIFSNLAGDVAAKDEFSPEKLAEIKAAKTEVEPQPVAEVKPEGNLFGDVSGDIDDIFASLAPEDAQKEVIADLLGDLSMDEPATPAQPTPQPASAKDGSDHSQHDGGKPGAGREVKEFGRLSAAATSKTELAAPGTLKTIGQMLLDTSAVENIIKRAEARGDAPVRTSSATARVVSVSRGADIQAMLNEIASYPGVDGSLVIGKDGLLIGATESLGMMRDVYGVLALGMQGTTNLGTKKIDMGELRQAILRTGEKYIVMTEVGIGVLAVFSDHWNLSTLDGLLEHIGRIVKASDASGGASLPTETLGAGMLSEDAPPPAAPPQPAAPIVDEDAVVPIQDSKGGLLNVNDDDIGGLFDGVLSDPSTHDDAISGGAPAPTPAPVASAGGLLNVGDDVMDDIFDNLLDNADSAASVEQAMDFSPATEAAPAAETPAAPEAPAPAKPAPGSGGQQIKEFGRLSTSSQAAAAGQESGSIKAIGRQLIDVQAVENIIKAGEKRERMGAGLTTARVISAARGEGIKALLTKIDTYPGVQGSLIVGNDGLVIASTLTGGLDKDLLGALCCAMHSHSDLAGKKLEMGKMKQIIFHATDKMTILTAVAVGVLAVFVENHDMTQIDSLLAAIEGTVRG